MSAGTSEMLTNLELGSGRVHTLGENSIRDMSHRTKCPGLWH